MSTKRTLPIHRGGARKLFFPLLEGDGEAEGPNPSDLKRNMGVQVGWAWWWVVKDIRWRGMGRGRRMWSGFEATVQWLVRAGWAGQVV